MAEQTKDRFETPQLILVKATIALLEAEEALFETRQRLEDAELPLQDWPQSALFQESQAARNRFKWLLGADLAEGSWDRFFEGGIGNPWPEPPDDFDSRDLVMLRLRSNPESRWGMWYVLFNRPERDYDQVLLIGTASFKHPPSNDGTVEIGYRIVDRYQAVDLAAEAVGALVTYAFQDPSVKRVVARTSTRHVPTIRVLGKNGFRRVGIETSSGLLLFQRNREADP